MDSSSAFAPSVLEMWRRRENLLPGLVLIALAAAGWAYVAYQAASMGSMHSSAAMGGMEMDPIAEAALFLSAWTAMMVAMMVPATLPLILLYRTIARNRLSSAAFGSAIAGIERSARSGRSERSGWIVGGVVKRSVRRSVTCSTTHSTTRATRWDSSSLRNASK